MLLKILYIKKSHGYEAPTMGKIKFKLPTRITIMGRKSSITNALVNGIIPTIQPTDEQIRDALKILEQDENDVRCVYCGDPITEWDHLHPLIRNEMPTGYITEIGNLVPACGKCNQSKGNSGWKDWMLGNAKQSPKSRNIHDIERRINLLEKYDNHFKKNIVNLKELAGDVLWDKYIKAYNSIISQMKLTQKIMDEIYEKTSKLIPARKQTKNLIRGSKGKNMSNPTKIEKVTINGCTLPLYRKDSQSVQDFVKEIITTLFKNHFLTDKEISLLQSKQYCIETFDIYYPLLEKNSSNLKDADGHARYWMKFNAGGFYVCSQWWKEKYAVYDDKIAKWLMNLGKKHK